MVLVFWRTEPVLPAFKGLIHRSDGGVERWARTHGGVGFRFVGSIVASDVDSRSLSRIELADDGRLVVS